jgi:hypothetical protein
MSGRIRSIKPEWLEDEKMAFASSDARVLSVGLILLADDYGRGRANEVLLSAHVFPREKTTRTLARALFELEKMAFIKLYEVNEQHYYQIRNWTKHQKVDHPGKQQLPSPSESLAKSSRESRESLAPDRDHRPSTIDHRPSISLSGSRNTRESLAPLSSSKTELDGVLVEKTKFAPEILAVFDHYRAKHPRSHPKPKSTSKEWRVIRARLAEGHTVEQLCQAIDGMHMTPHNLGQNDRGQEYLGLELCMRNGDQVNRFARTAEHGPPVAAYKTDKDLAREAAFRGAEEYNARVRERNSGVVFDASGDLVRALPGGQGDTGDDPGLVEPPARFGS